MPTAVHDHMGGVELIGGPRGTGRRHHGVVHGAVCSVVRVDEANVTLEMNGEYRRETQGEDDDDDVANVPETVNMPLTDVPRVLRLTHAMCYFTVQGRTLRDKHLLLLDTTHSHFSRRALVVGMSRATHGSCVHVASNEYEEFITGRRRKPIARI